MACKAEEQAGTSRGTEPAACAGATCAAASRLPAAARASSISSTCGRLAWQFFGASSAQQLRVASVIFQRWAQKNRFKSATLVSAGADGYFCV
jgi:hypothetical protein